MSGQDAPLRFEQETEIWPYEQMVYAQHRTCPGEWPLGIWDTNGSPNHGQTTRPYNNPHKKRELAKLWTLLSWQTIQENWKKAKRNIITRNFQGKWKKYWK